MSRPLGSGLLILSEVAVDRVAEPAFQRPSSLGRGLRLGDLALVELPARTVGADLADGDEVQGTVELTVAGPGEPVTALLEASIGAVPQ